jgi:hypothetical protein
MRRLIINAVTACLLLGSAGFAFATRARYEEGVIVVKFRDVLNIEKIGDSVITQYPNINELNELFGVYEIDEIFDFLPEEPVNDPHGKWEWRH